MIKIVPLQLEYCEAVAEIAKESLPESWSVNEIRNVLNYDYNFYYVAYEVLSKREDVSSFSHVSDKIAKSQETFAPCTIVGFAGAMLIDHDADLLNIAVKKEFRGRGIGNKLLETLMQTGKQRGMNRMLLEVRESNHVARSLYLEHGFLQIAMRKNYYHNPTEDAVIMECIVEG